MPDEPMDDDQLTDLLGRALRRAEPVPEHARDGALAAFGFRDLDGALAELVTESMAGFRDEEPGPLTFETEHAEVAVEVTDGRLVGQVAPPETCRGAVESPRADAVAFTTDDLGRFAVDVPVGPLRVVIDHPAGRVRTDWFQA